MQVAKDVSGVDSVSPLDIKLKLKLNFIITSKSET